MPHCTLDEGRSSEGIGEAVVQRVARERIQTDRKGYDGIERGLEGQTVFRRSKEGFRRPLRGSEEQRRIRRYREGFGRAQRDSERQGGIQSSKE